MRIWDHAYARDFKGPNGLKKSQEFKDLKGSSRVVKRVIYQYDEVSLAFSFFCSWILIFILPVYDSFHDCRRALEVLELLGFLDTIKPLESSSIGMVPYPHTPGLDVINKRLGFFWHLHIHLNIISSYDGIIHLNSCVLNL